MLITIMRIQNRISPSLKQPPDSRNTLLHSLFSNTLSAFPWAAKGGRIHAFKGFSLPCWRRQRKGLFTSWWAREHTQKEVVRDNASWKTFSWSKTPFSWTPGLGVPQRFKTAPPAGTSRWNHEPAEGVKSNILCITQHSPMFNYAILFILFMPPWSHRFYPPNRDIRQIFVVCFLKKKTPSVLVKHNQNQLLKLYN